MKTKPAVRKTALKPLSEALTAGRSWMLIGSRSSWLHGGENLRLDLRPIHALAFGFKDAAQPRVFVHHHENRGVDEQVNGDLSGPAGGTGTALNFKLPAARPAISALVPVKNVQRLKSAP